MGDLRPPPPAPRVSAPPPPAPRPSPIWTRVWNPPGPQPGPVTPPLAAPCRLAGLDVIYSTLLTLLYSLAVRACLALSVSPGFSGHVGCQGLMPGMQYLSFFALMTLFHLWDLPGNALAAPESASGLDRCYIYIHTYIYIYIYIYPLPLSLSSKVPDCIYIYMATGPIPISLNICM